MIKHNLLTLMAVIGLSAYAEPDNSNSILFVNEDWYGHQNSTINILRPDEPNG